MILILVICGVIFNVVIMISLCILIITRFGSIERRLEVAFGLIKENQDHDAYFKEHCARITAEHDIAFPKCKEL